VGAMTKGHKAKLLCQTLPCSISEHKIHLQLVCGPVTGTDLLTYMWIPVGHTDSVTVLSLLRYHPGMSVESSVWMPLPWQDVQSTAKGLS
jgi:hypothetical protein